jgi:RHS repeat-associated protein
MPVTERGFTCHEHMEDFGLINMNGRIYDPLLGRFLSVDPLIQDATSTQNFNSYSYCINNPLKYSDPSGYTRYPYEERTFEQYAFPNASGGNSSFISGTGSRFLDFYLMSSAFRHEGATICYRGSTFRYNPENEIFVSSNGQVLSSNLNPNTTNTKELTDEEIDAINFYIELFLYQSEGYIVSWSGDLYGTYTVGLIAPENMGEGNDWDVAIRYGTSMFGFCFGYSTNGVDGLSTASNITGGVGVAGTGLGMVNGTFRLTKSGKFSPGYYASGWQGNQYVKATYSVSKVGNAVSTGANMVTTGIAYYQITDGSAQPITYVDAGVGTIGIIASGASYFYGIQIPVVGEFVTVYGTVRVTWDVFYLDTCNKLVDYIYLA